MKDRLPFVWWIFLLAPVLTFFKAPLGLSVGDYLVLFCFLYLFFFGGIEKTFYFFSMTMVILFVPYLTYYFCFYSEGVLPVLRMILFAFFCLFFCGCRKQDYAFLKAYGLIATIAGACLVFQWVLFNYFGYFFTYFDSKYGIEENALLLMDLSKDQYRTGGLFREPSYFAVFTAPALFYFARTRQWLNWFWMSFCVFLSTSVLGLMFVVLSLIVQMVYLVRNKLVVILFLAIFVLLTYVAIVTNTLPERLVETLNGGASFRARVLDGSEAIFDLPKYAFYPNLEVWSLIEAKDGFWLNSFYYLIVMFGFGAGILWLLYFMCVPNILILVLFVLLMTTNSVSSPYFLTATVVLRALVRSTVPAKKMKLLKCNIEFYIVCRELF
ncbi:hypothetical protein HZU75_02555 [Chitinibacter fontanus]|uniref:Uncharacterized protein n=1 Tax=Chitinibacter fontanus TaxID=1737446 RepID=A0A7D5ZH63_9NEIS|nr:hypothetical protein [Chitinibacter fontanus]QLI80510.1 hypothetical protein HZU75_02555 [Chitinibacter fontanus]